MARREQLWPTPPERLRGTVPLSADDVAVLTDACTRRGRCAPAIIDKEATGGYRDRELEAGPALQILPDGGRQIMAFMLPGDFCDIHIAVLEEMDHSIVTLTKARVASLPRQQMEALVEARPAITRAFWWSQLVDQGVLRAWIVSMGRRKSMERVAHLMCELYIRMRNIGLATDDQCEMPLTQIVLADAVGLTPVHVNRVLKKLRLGKVMELRAGS